jgi:hypothetical protein
VTRRDLIPSEPDHPRAGNWYYALQLGPLEHKLPLIVSTRWRRVTFIVTTGDRFMSAHEINDLFEQESPAGQLYVKLKEMGILVEREWWIGEEGTAYGYKSRPKSQYHVHSITAPWLGVLLQEIDHELIEEFWAIKVGQMACSILDLQS